VESRKRSLKDVSPDEKGMSWEQWYFGNREWWSEMREETVRLRPPGAEPWINRRQIIRPAVKFDKAARLVSHEET
jgi:hypothetical protein